MIPKIIHYCWFGKNEFSPLHKECIKSWEEYLVDYKLIRWDESNSPMEHPFIKYHYQKKNWAFVSDFVRLYALYHNGGIYLDVDFEVIKNLDPFLDNNCFLGLETEERLTNGICGGEKGHIFFKKAMEVMEKRHYERKAIMTSPEVTMITYDKLKLKNNHQDIKIYSSEYFYPYNPFDKDPTRQHFLYKHITEKTYAIHHWAHSWKQNILARIKRKVLLRLLK